MSDDNGSTRGSEPTIIIKVGDLGGEGNLIGLKVSQVREMLEKDARCTVTPGSEVLICTGNSTDEAWQDEVGEQHDALVTRQISGGVQFIECVGKVVSEEYIIRRADILINFREPE